MNLDELSEDARRENILSIMIAMSKVDDVIHENEMLYILQLGFSMGMEEEDIRNISLKEQTDIYVPSSEAERMSILYYLVFLIKVDGVITEEEKNMMYHFGLKLGFNHLMVSNLILVIQANIGRKLPPDALIQEVRKYLN
jgi:uncharacterized membrane protein YebE (DUF533 family)